MRERHTFVGRVDEPAVADVDTRVNDLPARRVRAAVAEEDDVGGLELLERDPLRARHLDAHVVRRPPPDRRREVALVRIALELVDAPDEAGAVVAAARRYAERRLGAIARSAPDVRHTDLRD